MLDDVGVCSGMFGHANVMLVGFVAVVRIQGRGAFACNRALDSFSLGVRFSVFGTCQGSQCHHSPGGKPSAIHCCLPAHSSIGNT